MSPTRHTRSTPLIALAALAAATGSALAAGDMPASRADLDAAIREYILKNPKVLREALQTLEADEATEQAKTVLRGVKDDIYKSGAPEIGPAGAKIGIVVFMDYNCQYCRSTYGDVRAFMKTHADTKLIVRDVASFGKNSEAVGRIALAAARQGKFEAVHDAFMAAKGTLDAKRALDIAGKLGLNAAQLEKDARAPETGAMLTASEDLANKLNVAVTPLYIVGHRGISGAPEDLTAQLAAHVEDVRKSGCDVC